MAEPTIAQATRSAPPRGIARAVGQVATLSTGWLVRSPWEDRAVREPPTDEAELVERAKAGDVRAFEAIVLRYEAVALRTAHAILGSAPEVEDAVQEAFVKAYYALGRFRSGSPMRPWLLRIVANEALDHRRASKRAVGLGLRPDADLEPVDVHELAPEASAVLRERQEELLAAVNALRPDDRLVIAYRYWFDMAEGEMALALGCARGTVKSRLSRALGRLRASLPRPVADDRRGPVVSDG
jgi:RNA polymerase sigma factor (sigma-70 family)